MATGSFRLVQSSKPSDNYVTILAIYDSDQSTSGCAKYEEKNRQRGAVSNNRGPKSSTWSKASFARSVQQPLNRNLDLAEFKGFDDSHKPLEYATHIRGLSEDHYSSSVPRIGKDGPGGFLNRSAARKSRFTDAFLDAKERLDDELLQRHLTMTSVKEPEGDSKMMRILLSPDTINITMGVEISAVPDPFDDGRISCVEVMRIEEGGRIAEDGRLKIGDQIFELQHQKCSEMSMARARLLLHDMKSMPQPTICYRRRDIHAAVAENANSLSQVNGASQHATATGVSRPLKSALQQANTSKVGDTYEITIKKARSGLGFSFAGRTNADGIHLYYVKAVCNDGAAGNLLRIGDRILKIMGTDLDAMEQDEVANLLKGVEIGKSVKMLISRVSLPDEPTVPEHKKLSQNTLTFSHHMVRPEQAPSHSDMGGSSMQAKLAALQPERRVVAFDVTLNDSPSAGLGISLKAQKTYDDAGKSHDSGLYIKNILHGSAAFKVDLGSMMDPSNRILICIYNLSTLIKSPHFKDGRLEVDDRLIGIEDVDLLNYSVNGEALDAFIRRISTLPPNSSSVRIYVARKCHANASAMMSGCYHAAEAGSSKKGTPADENLSDASSLAPDPESFSRDTVARKSISEKRPFGGANDDVAHLQTYLRIKHQRQTSTPALKSTSTRVELRAERYRRSLEERNKKHLSIPPEHHRVQGLQPAMAALHVEESSIAPEGRHHRPDAIYTATQNSANFHTATLDKPCDIPRGVKKESSLSKNFFDYFFGGGSSGKDGNKNGRHHHNGSDMGRDDSQDSPRRRSSSAEHHKTPHGHGRSSSTSRAKRQQPAAPDESRPRIPYNEILYPAYKDKAAAQRETMNESPQDVVCPEHEAESHLRQTKERRRKSAGSGLLKFLQRSGPTGHNVYPENFYVADEDGVSMPWLQQGSPSAARRSRPAPPSYLIQMEPPRMPATPESHHRAPPPPYGGLHNREHPHHQLYAPTPYGPMYHHQRVQSAQEPPEATYKEREKGSSELIRHHQRRHSAGRRQRPTQGDAIPWPQYRPSTMAPSPQVPSAHRGAEGQIASPFYWYESQPIKQPQGVRAAAMYANGSSEGIGARGEYPSTHPAKYAGSTTTDYYDAFNAWFAYSGGSVRESAEGRRRNADHVFPAGPLPSAKQQPFEGSGWQNHGGFVQSKSFHSFTPESGRGYC